MKYKKITISNYEEIYQLSNEIYSTLKDMTYKFDIPQNIRSTLEEIKSFTNQILDHLTDENNINEMSNLQKKYEDELYFYRKYGWIW